MFNLYVIKSGSTSGTSYELRTKTSKFWTNDNSILTRSSVGWLFPTRKYLSSQGKIQTSISSSTLSTPLDSLRLCNCYEDFDSTHSCKHRIMSALNFCVGPQKFQKYYLFPHGATKASRLTWRNLFRHLSSRSAILGQIVQNAPGQPWVDRKSIKIIPIQHFSCFYIKPELLGDFCQL